MTELGYTIWLLVAATLTIALVTVGTLAAAGLLPPDRDERRPRPVSGEQSAHEKQAGPRPPEKEIA